MTRSLNIAVADDEPDVLDYFRVMLPRLGHRVVVAARTGSELVELCCKCKPDVIIADVRMPELTGDAAIEQICQLMPTPFILMSAFCRPLELSGAVAAVPHAYLTKPVKRNDLNHAIDIVCFTDRANETT